MRWVYLIVGITFLSFSSPSEGQVKKIKSYKKKAQHLTFGDETIVSDRKTPGGESVIVKQTNHFSSLIKMRKDFNAMMIKSAELF